uniref:G-protein coupled receptors family 2 profile 2 domain-containing protein n=1 Tax=Dendroctonus ponderosae TaxID=77166 RepID=A0AAR5PP33_DENPD
MHFALVILAFLPGLSESVDFCRETSNATFYRDLKVENCGCDSSVCIRKCCKDGFYLSPNKTCRAKNTSEFFEFPLYKEKTQFIRNVSLQTNFTVGVLPCQYYQLNISDRLDEFFVQETGTLWMPHQKCGTVYENTDYCVDEKNGFSVFLCFPTTTDAAKIAFKLNASGMIISMPFLLITFLVYALLPDRNLHQRALMFYVLSLLIAYILLVTINLAPNIPTWFWCKFLGYSTLFFFMVSFFWMNVICFDIWYTFSGGRGFMGSKRTSERRRLIFYSLYANGVPLLIVAWTYGMQISLPNECEHNPGIGVAKCFLATGWASLWYFYLEAGIVVIANITFFILTALRIRKVKQETSMLKHNDSKRHTYEKDKQKFNLYVKLLFAMGVNWSMEVISWLVNWNTKSEYQYIWYATDFFNAVYGVFIFFIFVFKKKIWTLLQRRYYNFIGRPHLAHTVTSSNTRSSHYSSTNYSTADTGLSERATAVNGRQPAEEMALRRVT